MSGVDIRQVRDCFVIPALSGLGMDSRAARALILGTGIVETGYRYVKQVGGPALGFWQMEPATYHDLLGNTLRDKKPLLAIMAQEGEAEDHLVTRPLYAAMLSRVLYYYRSKTEIPNDAVGLAQYHKTLYNTAGGAAVVSTNTPLFKEALDAV